MPGTQEKIQTDLKEAMKAGLSRQAKAEDEVRLSLLRGVSASLHNEEIKKRSSGKSEPLSEEEVVQTLQREAKKRKEAAELFRTGNRPELAEKEEKELEIIQAYLPKQMSRDEIRAVVDKMYDAGNSEFNTLIKAVMAEVRGRADGGTVSAVIKEKLGQ